jgi:hypothetical protein
MSDQQNNKNTNEVPEPGPAHQAGIAMEVWQYVCYYAQKPESPEEIHIALVNYGSSATRSIDVCWVEKSLLRLQKRGLVQSSDGGKTWHQGPNRPPDASEEVNP